jgi:hypothetical protein
LPTSSTYTVNVLGPDFQITGLGINIAAAGQSGSTNLTVTPVYGFTGLINFTCDASQIPEATCSVSPASLVTSGTVTVSLTTTAPSTTVPIPAPPWFVPVGVVALLCASLFLAIPGRRWRPKLAFGVLSAALLAGILVGCGGGSSSGGGANHNLGTPAGDYTLWLTATSGSLTHKLNIDVIIQ